ncbi:MAG: hypothetical protein KBD27_01910 [Candidatus Moranbacteria bacterium]|nr:hypothetical protein [Candidatus Moranbacteria bacterium]
MKTLILLVGAMLLVVCGLTQAEQAVTPYELRHVNEHCGTTAPFINVRVRVQLEGGAQMIADVINCLSKKDDKLVSILCDLATEKCNVSRERDKDAPAIEEELRRLRQPQTPQNNKV